MRPGNKVGHGNNVGPRNKFEPWNKVGPWNKVRPGNKIWQKSRGKKQEAKGNRQYTFPKKKTTHAKHKKRKIRIALITAKSLRTHPI